MYVYSLISPWAQHSQFTSLVLELSLIQSHLLLENSTFAHFAAAIANHYNLAFSFHQVPITAGWTKEAWYERLAQHLYTWPTAWLEHRSPIRVGPTNRAPRCLKLTSVIWRELVTTLPCATMKEEPLMRHSQVSRWTSALTMTLRGQMQTVVIDTGLPFDIGGQTI